ncbi:UNVERIFIED_CONTAM: hypothetical protein Sindi_0965500 [Sesamum indicum]
MLRSKGIIRIPRPSSRRSHRSTSYFGSKKLKMSYWWDCDDESMLKIVKSQSGSSCGNGSLMPRASWLDRCGWPRRSSASS